MNILIAKIKKHLKLLLKREYPFKIQTKIAFKWMGNLYGGFYAATQYVNKDSVVFSFGIGEDISFDTEISNLTKCTIHGFDPTPKSINWIKNNKELPEGFHFHEYGIDVHDGFVTFFLPENKNYVSGSIVTNEKLKSDGIKVPMKSFKTICEELGYTCIDVIKMDIEGAEYSVIPDILSSGIKIKQILIEFHHRFYKDGFKRNEEMITLMNKHGYKIFAVSDSLEEVSFININN